MKNLIGFARLRNLDRWLCRKATACSIETINLGGITASYSCVQDEGLALVRSLRGKHVMQVLLQGELRGGDIVYDIRANIRPYSVPFREKVGTNKKSSRLSPRR